MKTEGSRVLVTGAGGFIGSHLTEALVQCGASVRALVHYNSRNDWGMLEESGGSIGETGSTTTGETKPSRTIGRRRTRIALRKILGRTAGLTTR